LLTGECQVIGEWLEGVGRGELGAGAGEDPLQVVPAAGDRADGPAAPEKLPGEVDTGGTGGPDDGGALGVIGRRLCP